MGVPDEMIFLFLFLLQLLELARLQQCSVARIVNFDIVRTTTKTPKFCAVSNAGVTQKNGKNLEQCSRECADEDVCVGFNHKEPQLVCELFQTPFSTLSLTPGCTHYEVSPLTRNQKTSRTRNSVYMVSQ